MPTTPTLTETLAVAQDYRLPLRSNMEAGGVTKDANRNTLHATAQLLPSQRFPIHKWEPRTGYNEDYIKWKLDVMLVRFREIGVWGGEIS